MHRIYSLIPEGGWYSFFFSFCCFIFFYSLKSHFLLILLHDLPSSRKRIYSNICWWSLVFIHIWKWELEESVMNSLYIVYFIGRENSLQENGQSSSFGVATYLLGIFFWVCYIFPEKGRFSNLAELQRQYKIGRWHSGSVQVKIPKGSFHLANQCVHFHWVH